MPVDPAISALIAGLDPGQQLVVLLSVMNSDPRHVYEAISQITPGPNVNYLQPVGGQPLFHWMGKSLAQIRLEVADDATVTAIVAAIHAAGVANVLQDTPVRTNRDIAIDRAHRAPVLPSAPPAAGVNAPRSGKAGLMANAYEPTFGTDQIPASELWNLTDAELLTIPGIDAGAIAGIREAKERAEFARMRNQVGAFQAPISPAGPNVPPSPLDTTDTAEERELGTEFPPPGP